MSGDLDPSVSVGKRRVGIGGPGWTHQFLGEASLEASESLTLELVWPRRPPGGLQLT